MLQFQEFVFHYGYLAVFGFLALGIFGLPLPDELLVAFIGHMAKSGDLSLWLSMIFTITGVMCGTIFTYTIGRGVGKPLLDKYGKWIRLTPERIGKVDRWFHKYGAWTVTFGFLVPGMRHLICYLSGSTRMDMKRYLLFSSIGTLFSSAVFLTIGYLIRFPFI